MSDITAYFDTNIYLDYLLGRKSLMGRDIGDIAFKAFNKSLRCDFSIMISDKILEELYANIDTGSTKSLLAMLHGKGKLVKVTADDGDIQKSKELSEHYQDALHALTARRYKADFVVTRNIEHFKEYSHLIEIKLPEDI